MGLLKLTGEKPYENSGIKEGDLITSVNNKKINTINELIDIVSKSNGKEIDITYKRGTTTRKTNLKPVKTEDDNYKIGLWVRDTAAGVGTITFYEPNSKKFASLGHGINDIDTSELINIQSGELVTADIVSIEKGEKGNPGEIKGTIDEATFLGEILKNSKFGIYGNIKNIGKLEISKENEVKVALRDEIKLGDAEIICELEDGKVEKYKIEIQKIFNTNNENNKSMVIKVTDDRLIKKTGGIVQGMSGTPIIQNGKFIGAVTHVLINNPKVGYGIFADLMIKQLNEE